MIVFISWHSDRSFAIAKALHDWLPKVVQTVKPFISSKIEKGTSGLEKIREKLEESSFGIICLTPENRNSNWIHFEAGALSKLKDEARLWTVLYELKTTDIVAPLSQFQHTLASKGEIFSLIESINDNTSEKLDVALLRDTFEMWWPKLEEELEAVAKIPIGGDKEARAYSDNGDIRSQKEIVEEILELVRGVNERSLTDSGTIARQLNIRNRDRRWDSVQTVIIRLNGSDSQREAELTRERIDMILRDTSHWTKILPSKEGYLVNVYFDGPFSRELMDSYLNTLMAEGRRISGWTNHSDRQPIIE